MTEQPTEPDTTSTEPAAAEFEPITSQDALNKLIGERIAGVKRKYADYDELRSKATEYDKLQESSKSEAQKWQDKFSALENELKSERLTSLKASVAAEKGVPASALNGDTREELEACADRLVEWRSKQEPPAKPKTTTGFKSGATNQDSRLDPMERAAAALRGIRG